MRGRVGLCAAASRPGLARSLTGCDCLKQFAQSLPVAHIVELASANLVRNPRACPSRRMPDLVVNGHA